MRLSIQPQFPAALPTVPIEIGGWVNRKPVRTFWRRDKSLALVRIRTPNHLACSLVTMVTTLSRLRVFKEFPTIF